MREMSMRIIEEEEDTAYHVLFDDSGPGSATSYASYQYKHVDMRSIYGNDREHTYRKMTGPQNLVVNLSKCSSRSKNDRAIEMTRIERRKDTRTSATLPLIDINEAARISLLPV